MIGDNNTPLSPSEESDLSSLSPYLQGAAPVTQNTDQPPSILGRIGEQAANLPLNMGEGFLNMLGGVAQLGVPAAARQTVDLPNVFNIPKAQTLGEQAVDTGANLVSQLPSFLAPELAVGKLAGAAGLGATASRVVGAAAAGAANATQDTTDMGVQAGVMGTLAAMSPLARLNPIRLLGTAALAAGSGAYTYSQTGDSTAAFTNAGILATLGMLPGAHSDGANPTRTQEANTERGIVPFNPGTQFTMGEGSDPGTVINIPDSRYQGRNWSPFGGYLGDSPDSGVPLLGDRQPLTPGNLLPNRENPYGFTQGDVTSQPNGNTGRFTLGADTTPVPDNGGLPAPNAPLQLLGPQDQMPATKQVGPAAPPDETHTLQMPPGMNQLRLQLPPDQSQIVSTAFKSADGKTVYVGNKWNDGHDLIPLTHGMWDDDNNAPVSPTQEQRGFIVHNADGTQTFENRNDALAIAKKSGQAPADLDPPLNSTDLIDRSGASSETGSGDQTPIIQPPSSDVTSQSDSTVPPSGDDLPVTHPGSPHFASYNKLVSAGLSDDPYTLLKKGSTPNERQGMFAAARKAGFKAGTIAKLAEVSQQLPEVAGAQGVLPAPEPPARTPDPIIAPAKDSTDVAPTPAVVDAPPPVQPDPVPPVARTPDAPPASTAPDPQKAQVDPNTPPSELPPSKGSAALSGDEQLLTGSTAHMEPLDQEDMQFYRDQHAKYSNPTSDDYSPVDAQTQLDRMQDLSDKYAGGADNIPVPVTSSDMAIARANAKADADLQNRGQVLKADRGGGNVTSQPKAPKLMGAADQAWSSLSHVAEADEVPSNPVPSFSEDPEGNDKATVKNIIDQLQVPDFDDNFEPKPEDLDAVSKELPADDSADPNEAKSADDNSGNETDKLSSLMDLLSKPAGDSDSEKFVAWKRQVTDNPSWKPNAGGFVDREIGGMVARYGVSTLAGATVGAAMDKENHLRGLIIGAASGFALGHMGPAFLNWAMKDLPQTVKENYKAVADVASHPATGVLDIPGDLAAQSHGATGQGISDAMRKIQRSFTMSDQARDIKGIQNLSGIEKASTDALTSMRETYEALPNDKKAAVDKYYQQGVYKSEDYVDPADGKVKTRWIPNDMTGVESKFAADMAAHPVAYGQTVTAKDLRVKMQEMIAKNLPDGPLKNTMLKTMGEYQTDAYRIFMNPKYRPTQLQIDKAIDSMQWLKMYPSYDRPMLSKVVQSYLDNIFLTRKASGSPGGGGGDSGTFNDILKRKGSLPEDLEKRIIAAVPGAKSVDEIVTSQRSLPDALKAELNDQIGKGNYMTPAYRDMLGYFSSPVEREAVTHMKLMPAAQAASLFNIIATKTSDLSGLPLSMDPDTVANKRATLQAQLTTATDPKIRQGIQVQLKDLRDRVILPNSPNLGILAGRYVPSSIYDLLPNLDQGVMGGQQFAVTQAIQDYNRVMKAGQTILNPINHLKWIYNAPILAGLSGTGPGDVLRGFQVAAGEGKNAAILRRMQDLGIAETSIARSEFNTTAKQVLGGNFDSSVVDKLFSNKVVAWAADKYGMSDNAIRIGTFMARERQVLDRLAPDVLAGRVTSQEAAATAEKEAISHTNRYTINYGVVPGGVAYLRKFPFVSLYLTYSYEMARITKNIAMDAIGKGPMGKNAIPGAITKLAGLAAIPAALQAMGRAALSPDDQKAWDESIKLDQPYAQPRFRIPLTRRADGSFKYVDFTSWVPTGDWNMFGRAVASGDWKQMLAANPVLGTDNTPALNIATEIITGQDSRTGRPINTIGRTLDAARQEVAPAFLGGYEFDNLMRALQPNDDGANGGLGVTRMGSGKGYSWQDLLWTYATTLRPTTINVDWQQRTAVAQAQSQIATEKQFMMDTLATNMTADVKQKAVKRFQDAATIIVANMKAKMDNQ